MTKTGLGFHYITSQPHPGTTSQRKDQPWDQFKTTSFAVRGKLLVHAGQVICGELGSSTFAIV